MNREDSNVYQIRVVIKSKDFNIKYDICIIN